MLPHAMPSMRRLLKIRNSMPGMLAWHRPMHARGNDTEAIRILEAARSKRPGRYLLEYYFGLLASRLGREDEAIVALERAAQLEPKSPDPSFELGKLYASKQDWPDARKAFEHVVELNPQFAPAHYQLSQVYAHLGIHAKPNRKRNKLKHL